MYGTWDKIFYFWISFCDVIKKITRLSYKSWDVTVNNKNGLLFGRNYPPLARMQQSSILSEKVKNPVKIIVWNSWILA
jgi:hypothetical protein